LFSFVQSHISLHRILGKLMVAQLAKIFCIFFGTLRFIAIITWTCLWSSPDIKNAKQSQVCIFQGAIQVTCQVMNMNFWVVMLSINFQRTVSPPSSWSNSKLCKNQQSDCCLVGLFFDPESGDSISELLPNCQSPPWEPPIQQNCQASPPPLVIYY
jgi:hypothetical protein